MKNRMSHRVILTTVATVALVAVAFLGTGTAAVDVETDLPETTVPAAGHPPLPGIPLWQTQTAHSDSFDYVRDMATATGDDLLEGVLATVFVTGDAPGDSPREWVTTAYNGLTGVEVWSASSEGPGGSFDYARAIGVSPDGSAAYVTGSQRESTSFTDNRFTTIGYDAATGDELWKTSLDGDRGVGWAVAATDDTVFVAGEAAETGQFARKIVTAALDAEDGSVLWEARFDGGGSSSIQQANALATDGENVYVTGRSSGDSFAEFTVLAYDGSTGDLLWSDAYNHAGSSDWGNDIAVSDGTVVATGRVFESTFSGGTGTDVVTAAYDAATGDRLWLQTYALEETTGDSGEAVAVDGERAYVTGNLRGDSFDDQYAGTLAYDMETGELEWEALLQVDDERTWGRGNALGGLLGGTLFIVGDAYDDGCCDRNYVVSAYDTATGAELWSDVNSVGSADWARGIATSPLGERVFIGGDSTPEDGGRDWVITAYLNPL